MPASEELPTWPNPRGTASGRNWIALGAILAGLAVTIGAFGAHGLNSRFAEQYSASPKKEIAGFQVPAAFKMLQDFKTGAEYQFLHALAILGLGLFAARFGDTKLTTAAGICFTLGIFLFSGSLYLYTLTGVARWAMVTPIGGLCFLIGWALFAAVAIRRSVARCRETLPSHSASNSI